MITYLHQNTRLPAASKSKAFALKDFNHRGVFFSFNIIFKTRHLMYCWSEDFCCALCWKVIFALSLPVEQHLRVALQGLIFYKGTICLDISDHIYISISCLNWSFFSNDASTNCLHLKLFFSLEKCAKKVNVQQARAKLGQAQPKFRLRLRLSNL